MHVSVCISIEGCTILLTDDVTELELEKDKDETKEQDHTPKEEEAPEAAPVNEIPTDGGQTNTTIEETPAA